MKKVIFMALVAMLAGIYTSNAQGGGGGFQRRSVEENVKAVMEKLAPLSLDKDQTIKADTAFTQFFKAREKMMDEVRNSTGDRSAMREKFQALSTERDDKLKKIFTEAQYKKWKEEIEPSMRPQRRGAGGQGGGGNQ